MVPARMSASHPGITRGAPWVSLALAALLGACGAVDNGADAAPDPQPDAAVGSDATPTTEICTPSTPGASPSDEDGDGVIDEDCA